jgi:holo-[acyl-carrier protein] synthase
MSTFAVTTGTDIISVPRIDRLRRTRGGSFLRKWFTADEIGYCLSKSSPSQHFAARLAAKEAVLKALRTSWQGPLPWQLIEITHGADGSPGVRLLGPLGQLAAGTGLTSIDVSLSHTDEYATATAVAVTSFAAPAPGSGSGRVRAVGNPVEAGT